MTSFKVGDRVIITEKGPFSPSLKPIGKKATIKDIDELLSGNVEFELLFEPQEDFTKTVSQLFTYRNNGHYPFKPVNEKDQEMTTVSYTSTPDSISIFWNGKMHNIKSSDIIFQDLQKELQGIAAGGMIDKTTLDNLLDKPKVIFEKTQGNVTVRDGEVLYKGEAVDGPLVSKLLSMLAQDLDYTRWMKFLDNLMDNPSYRSRNCLYNFLEHFDTPITEDGCFLAFKRVRSNYMDIHSNSMDNSPGRVVAMDRRNVNEDPTQTCSSGLHACASNYLGYFYSSSDGYKVVVLKVNPRDVCAVPVDYSFSKMRVCQYEVLGDAEEADYDTVNSGRIPDRFEDQPSSFPWEDFDSELDDYDDDYDSYDSYE